MAAKLFLVLCAVGLAACAVSQQDISGPHTDGNSETGIDLLVRLHNQYRCVHTKETQTVDHDGDASTADKTLPKIALVHWSTVLETAAKCWAKEMASTGSFAHSHGKCGTDGMGENIAYYGGGGYGDVKARLEGAMKSFYDEYNDFKSGSTSGSSFGGAVGHFTQIVWLKTSTIGCGAAISTGSPYSKWYLSCNYKSPGNYGGQYANNVFCKNSNGQRCQPFTYSDSDCATAIAYEDTAGLPEFHGTDDHSIVSGTSANNPYTTRPGYHSDVTSSHATKVCWSTTLSKDPSSNVPSDPTCSQSSNCESSGHHEFAFNYGAGDKDKILTIKMIGCSGGGNSAVATQYFKYADSLPPAPIVFDPETGSTIIANSHIHAKSQAAVGSTTVQNAQKICYTINEENAAISHPTCGGSNLCETDHGDDLDLVVDHSETVAAVACVKKLDGTWHQNPSTGSAQAKYTVNAATGAFTDCDSALTGGFSSFLQSYCNAGCYTGYHKYLLINSKCNSVGYDYKSSEAATLSANPGKLVADTDGSRCKTSSSGGGFGLSSATVCSTSGGAAEEDGSNPGTSSAAWTTSTTVVLVVALVAMVAVGVAAFMVGKRSAAGAKQPKQPLTDLAEELEA